MSAPNLKIGDLLYLNEMIVFTSIYDTPWTNAFDDDPGIVGCLTTEEFCFFLQEEEIWTLIITAWGVKGWIETGKLRKVSQ